MRGNPGAPTPNTERSTADTAPVKTGERPTMPAHSTEPRVDRARGPNAPARAPQAGPRRTDECLLRVRGLDLDTAEGRPLVRGLTMTLGRDQVALIGRNGGGKSTLLEVLAGEARALRGEVSLTAEVRRVPQDPRRDDPEGLLVALQARADGDPEFARALLGAAAVAGLRPLPELLEVAAASSSLSRGEMRKIHLLAALLGEPDLLLVDEPTEDLDEVGLAWLLSWLPTWSGGLVVVSHDRRLLSSFRHFFLLAESGCRYIPGSFAEIEAALEREDDERQRRYVTHLNHLAAKEAHNVQVLQRRRRKKNVGRLHELRRRTSRSRLNEKRSYAQESQGRAAKIREERISGVRLWALATRRALAVKLPLELLMPTLDDDDRRPIIRLEGLGLRVSEGDHQRSLFTGIDLALGRGRLGIIGPNGAGKTSLLQLMLGQRSPTTGTVGVQRGRIGVIAQGATDWMSEESLLYRLCAGEGEEAGVRSRESAAQLLVAHRFPLALAERPLRSLSPGERVRAALICLLQRSAAPELLVLDEPTYSLDFVGVAALTKALAVWPGGLVVASHDHDFLQKIGCERRLALDGEGGHRVIVG